MSFLYAFESVHYTALICLSAFMMVNLYTEVGTVTATFQKLYAISLGDTSVTVSEEEGLAFYNTMKEIPKIWWLVVYINAWTLQVPFCLINKYVFSRLTGQQFVFQGAFLLDLCLFGINLHILLWHLDIVRIKNDGYNFHILFGTEPEPLPSIMYL